MVRDADLHFPNETGGVLMGYWPSDVEAVITDFIAGGPRAKRTTSRFHPDYDYQDLIIEEIYNASEGSRTYLGDWHTHPRGRLALSPTDKGTLRRIAKEPTARAGSPIMLLFAGDDKWDAAAWCWRPNRRFLNRIQGCPLILYDS
jgi:integrative and conjugative element protein (TIGR02256 family)